MKLIGAHAIIYSNAPDADRTFFKEVLSLPNVDVGEGWLIFALPPAELAVHPSDKNNIHELYLMCDNVEQFIGDMKVRGVQCTPIEDRNWGLLTELTLPGGGKLRVYQPLHQSPSAFKKRKRQKVVKRGAGKSKVRRK